MSPGLINNNSYVLADIFLSNVTTLWRVARLTVVLPAERESPAVGVTTPVRPTVQSTDKSFASFSSAGNL